MVQFVRKLVCQHLRSWELLQTGPLKGKCVGFFSFFNRYYYNINKVIKQTQKY